MDNYHKGGALLIIIVLIAVITIGAVMFGRSGVEDLAQETTKTVLDTATNKGVALIEDSKEKATTVVVETAQDVKDTAVAEGKKAIGEAMQDAGKKLVAQETPGTYEDYAPEKIAVSGGAILDFTASWCPSCRTLDKDITAHVQNIPSGVTILKVDYDQEKALGKKYGVTQQHTLVQVDANGNMIKKWVGSPTLADVLAKMEK